ncbi:MAG: hypothetical protein GY739_13360, partial [Mesoflavibacter sp.]|nr:hypothetical protein [Mesoflavibacter sp.]
MQQSGAGSDEPPDDDQTSKSLTTDDADMTDTLQAGPTTSASAYVPRLLPQDYVEPIDGNYQIQKMAMEKQLRRQNLDYQIIYQRFTETYNQTLTVKLEPPDDEPPPDDTREKPTIGNPLVMNPNRDTERQQGWNPAFFERAQKTQNTLQRVLIKTDEGAKTSSEDLDKDIEALTMDIFEKATLKEQVQTTEEDMEEVI